MTIKAEPTSRTSPARESAPVVVALVDASRPAPWVWGCIDQLRQHGTEVRVVAHPNASRAECQRVSRWHRRTALDPVVGEGRELQEDCGTADVVLDLTGGERSVDGSRPRPHGESWSICLSGGWRHPGLRAVLAGRSTMSVSLVRRRPDSDTTETLLRSTVAVVPTSVAETVDRVLQEAARLPVHAIRTGRVGAAAPEESASGGETFVSARWTVIDDLRLAVTLAGRRLRRALLQRTTESAWAVGVVPAPIETFLADPPLDRVDWNSRARRGTYLADPFAAGQSPLVVLAEEFDHVTEHGRIVSTTYQDDVGWSPTIDEVLTEGHHLSYPAVVELPDGRRLCVPESAKAGRVRAYELGPDGRAGRPVDVIEGVRAGDPCLWHHDGRWWLFYTDCRPPRDTHLYVWFADEPTGPWRSHPLNPVKSDVRSSRPGGTPFVHDGRLFRPAQDDAGTYGRCLVINEVHVLTPERFDESVVARVGPFGRGRYPWGPHTLSAAGPYTLLDGKRRVLSLPFAMGRRRHRRAAPTTSEDR